MKIENIKSNAVISGFFKSPIKVPKRKGKAKINAGFSMQKRSNAEEKFFFSFKKVFFEKNESMAFLKNTFK